MADGWLGRHTRGLQASIPGLAPVSDSPRATATGAGAGGDRYTQQDPAKSRDLPIRLKCTTAHESLSTRGKQSRGGTHPDESKEPVTYAFA